ncbi:MAG: 2Fe-2S iron-sulfur cluster binding domain-containing protein [Epsilonproteobacteria bacterium]|nr:2Fe-2S iron-sulfur cluster binding domain-containing protein [Campylobacterota bacterium]
MKRRDITITIDGKECKGKFGQTILEIAREHGIYIPTMCYLTKTLPIASCRMCVVDVKGVDGFILSCQEKAVDGIEVNTNTPELFKERQNIMKLYNVNHPLECGVCDQSGECELQNKTMEFEVAEQNFTARDQFRPVENWGYVSYDPSLCIMCEKCVRVSTEITGDEALKVKFGGYSSVIENVKRDRDFATLGEAAAVCPVGALVDRHFKYSANAWELKKIPSSCPHCEAGHDVTYEVKHGKVYRTSNEAEFSTMCSASRYGFDFANENVKRDREQFQKAIDAFKKAKSIIFADEITNEEALILQKLKEKFGYRLISHDARAFQKFMSAYSSISGKSLYGGDLKTLKKSDAIVVFGTRVNDDSPITKYHINMASKHKKARVVYMHPIEDINIKNIVTQFIKYEPNTEEGVIALLAYTLLRDKNLPSDIKELLDELDIGNISADTNIGEEELEQLVKSFEKRREFSLVVGADLYRSSRADSIAKYIALLERYFNFNLIVIPPATNGLGVSLICDLDDEVEGYTIGYNVKGDFTLSALGGGDLDMPSLIQQEGTTTSIDKRVVPLNVAVDYGGYTLNDIANALGLKSEWTVDYTSRLPENRGFRAVEFDALPNHFELTGEEKRGYILEPISTKIDGVLDEPVESDGIDGAVIYNCNPQEHFSPFTAKSELLKQNIYLLGSKQFSIASKLQDGDEISFEIDGVLFNRVFKIDTSLKGTIAINPTYDLGLSSALLSSYRFRRLERVGS